MDCHIVIFAIPFNWAPVPLKFVFYLFIYSGSHFVFVCALQLIIETSINFQWQQLALLLHITHLTCYELLTLIQSYHAFFTFLVERSLLAARHECDCVHKMVFEGETLISKMVISHIKWSFLPLEALNMHGVRREEWVLFPMYDVIIIWVPFWIELIG